jgi:hypothetical protein
MVAWLLYRHIVRSPTVPESLWRVMVPDERRRTQSR